MNPQPNPTKESDLIEFRGYWENFVKEVISYLSKAIKEGKDLSDSNKRIKKLGDALENIISQRWQEKAEKNFLRKYKRVDDHIRDFESNSSDIAQEWVKNKRVNFKPLKPLQVATVSVIISLLLFLVFYTEKLVIGISLTIGTLIILILLLKNRQRNWTKAKKKYISYLRRNLISEGEKIEREINNNESKN